MSYDWQSEYNPASTLAENDVENWKEWTDLTTEMWISDDIVEGDFEDEMDRFIITNVELSAIVSESMRNTDPNETIAHYTHNIVATFNSGVPLLNLPMVCRKLGWCKFNPETFAALIGCMKNPKTTILTFKSANHVCTGAKSENDARIACRAMCSAMQRKNIQCCMRDFRIRNIVAVAYTKFNLKLEDIAHHYKPKARFDPDRFPGLVFRMLNTNIVFTLFRQGKIVIAGGLKNKSIAKALKYLYQRVLLPFRDDNKTKNLTNHVTSKYTTTTTEKDEVNTSLYDVIGNSEGRDYTKYVEEHMDEYKKKHEELKTRIMNRSVSFANRLKRNVEL
jgi:transcription initiation factor TFIID TATA-box-binding protein